MKTKLIALAVTALALVLSSCSADEAKDTDGKKPVSQSKDTKQETNKEQEQTSTNHASDPVSTDSTAAEDDDAAPKSNLTQDEVITKVKDELKMKNTALPSSFPLEKSRQLSASIEENEDQSYKVVFFETKGSVPINDDSLTPDGNVPIAATVSAKTYQDAKSAAETFSDMNLDSIPEDMQVDLGHGIKGMEEGGAGHHHLSWQEGKWILHIDTISEDQMDNAGIAKVMVNYLEDDMLPAPKDHGRVEAVYKPGGKSVHNVLSWQEGPVIYRIETDKVPLDALKMAVSVNP
ncbi:hypothetical protein [Peribacillus kribbensis]|uniref:hypothetical protein n=1 Tax=Peribacillus kribbensis TaxID=356658 RepID=UPI000414CBD9|nr:hypothetical protein [Peribacillus kribbensis]